MISDSANFDSAEIGKLVIKLQRVCAGCSQHGASMRCVESAVCPVGLSRKMLGEYLQRNEQIITYFDFNRSYAKPRSAEFDVKAIREIFIVVHDLCNKCMFHSDKCFLNVVYSLLEEAIGKTPKKPASLKPGDDIISEKV